VEPFSVELAATEERHIKRMRFRVIDYGGTTVKSYDSTGMGLKLILEKPISDSRSRDPG